eukprot:2619299-Pyramimonas_sp.AAC.1
MMVVLSQGHCTHSFRGHKGVVISVLFHPDARKLLLFTGSDDAELRVWDLATRSPLATLDGHFSAVTGLSVSPCGQVLLSAGRDKVVNVWNLQTYKKAGTVPVYEALEGIAIVSSTAGFPGVGTAPLKSKVSAAYHSLVLHVVQVLCLTAQLYVSSKDRTTYISSSPLHMRTNVFTATQVFAPNPNAAPSNSRAHCFPQAKGVPGVHFLTAGETGKLKLWRSDTGTCIQHLCCAACVP